jgi:hypothetical protein
VWRYRRRKQPNGIYAVTRTGAASYERQAGHSESVNRGLLFPESPKTAAGGRSGTAVDQEEQARLTSELVLARRDGAVDHDGHEAGERVEARCQDLCGLRVRHVLGGQDRGAYCRRARR